VIRLRKLRWEGHVAIIEEMRGEVHTGFWWEDLREGNRLEDPDVVGCIILKLIFNKWMWGLDWIDVAQDRNS